MQISTNEQHGPESGCRRDSRSNLPIARFLQEDNWKVNLAIFSGPIVLQGLSVCLTQKKNVLFWGEMRENDLK